MIFLFLLFSQPLKADMIYTNQPCEAIMIPLTIEKKLNASQYEGVGTNNDHMILTLHKTKLRNTGKLYPLQIRRQGVKKMEMEDGFDESVFFYEECEK